MVEPENGIAGARPVSGRRKLRTITVSVRITPDQLKYLKDIAEARNLDVSALLREIIEHYRQ